MWIEIQPRPRDFCGQPPCPRCFHWQDGSSTPPLNGLHKMALDLLQKSWDDLSATERQEIEGLGRGIHKKGLAGLITTPEEPSPAGEAVDIGMSSVVQLEGWLRERKRTEQPKPRALNCDEIADRKAVREAKAAEKRKERAERMKEAREIAAVFAEAQQEQTSRQQYEEQRYLRNVDPSFVSYCRSRGTMDPREIAYLWERDRGPRSYMMDPNER